MYFYHGLLSACTLALAWCAIAFFSVFSSARSIIATQKEAIEGDRRASELHKLWGQDVQAIADFRSAVASELVDRDDEVQRGLTRAPTWAIHRQLKKQAGQIERARPEVEKIHRLPADRSESSKRTKELLNEAFGSVRDAWIALPPDLRAKYDPPRPTNPPFTSTTTSNVLFRELKNGTAVACISAVVAFLLDAIPFVLLYSCHHCVLTTGGKIRKARTWFREVWAALRSSPVVSPNALDPQVTKGEPTSSPW